MSFNFWFIIFVQLLFFVFLSMRKKLPTASLVKLLILSSLFGIFFGFLFDSVFGLLGLFTYVIHSTQSVYGTGLSIAGLVANGALSYGLAAATVFFLLPKKIKVKRFSKMYVVILSLIAIFIAASAALHVLPHTVFSLFLGGVAVLVVSEAFSLLFNENGPFVSFVRTRNYPIFFTFWFNCALIGSLYEFTNFLFPFWVWLPGVTISNSVVEVLVVLFGYVVLLHPMILFWQLIQKSKWLQI